MFNKKQLPLNNFERQLVERLKKDVVAKLSIFELENGKEIFESIYENYHVQLRNREETIVNLREKMNAQNKDESVKDYLFGFTSDKRGDFFQENSAILKLALHTQLLAIANAYTGMFHRLQGLIY